MPLGQNYSNKIQAFRSVVTPHHMIEYNTPLANSLATQLHHCNSSFIKFNSQFVQHYSKAFTFSWN